jgi:hypothetical protein
LERGGAAAKEAYDRAGIFDTLEPTALPLLNLLIAEKQGKKMGKGLRKREDRRSDTMTIFRMRIADKRTAS